MSIKQRVANFIGGAELREQQQGMAHAVAQLANAYEMGRYELPPDQLIQQLQEYTSGADLDYIMGLIGWEGLNRFTTDLNREREYAIRQSEHAWRHSPLYQWSVWSWTNWGMGDGVEVVPVDDKAKIVWDEFWTADRNASLLGQDKIHAQSEWLQVQGDRYWVHFASTVDGEDTIGSIPPSQFPDPPITDPQDGSLPLFYKRVWMSKGKQETLYYPSWIAFFNYPEKLDQEGLLPPNAKRADQPDGEQIGGSESPSTVAVIQHIAHNCKVENDLRGWPLSTISAPFDEAHKRFAEDRLTVAASKAMFVRRKSVNAGSRGMDSIASTLNSSMRTSGYRDTNPAAPAGSVELDNKQVTTTDMPMTTGASDAANDNKMFAWMALLGNGLFPTSAGLDTSRWATALAMDKNQSMLWSRYKSFVAQQFKNMVKIVLLFKEKYGSVVYANKSAVVSIDTLSMVDFPPVVDALSKMVSTALTPLVDNGVMPLDVARTITARIWLIALQALGITDAADLTSLEAFEILSDDQVAQGDEDAADDEAEPPDFAQEMIELQRRRVAEQQDAITQAADEVRAAAERIMNE